MVGFMNTGRPGGWSGLGVRAGQRRVCSFLMVGVEIAAFTMPLILIILFPTLMGETMGAIVLIALSLAVVASYRLWIRDIYRRMMKRRYENLESFRSSR